MISPNEQVVSLDFNETAVLISCGKNAFVISVPSVEIAESIMASARISGGKFEALRLYKKPELQKEV